LGRVAAQIGKAERARLRGLVRVGVQEATEVTLPGAGHLVHQIYASALPVAYADELVADWEPFARLVLEAAYLATFGSALAVGAGRLFLTRLGGGAFGNPPGWITDAMAGAIRAYRAADIDVQIVSHGASNPANRVLLT
jgi:O-acetyl-ADP-ribose deacetylase (regulator of RNase III)